MLYEHLRLLLCGIYPDALFQHRPAQGQANADIELSVRRYFQVDFSFGLLLAENICFAPGALNFQRAVVPPESGQLTTAVGAVKLYGVYVQSHKHTSFLSMKRISAYLSTVSARGESPVPQKSYESVYGIKKSQFSSKKHCFF